MYMKLICEDTYARLRKVILEVIGVWWWLNSLSRIVLWLYFNISLLNMLFCKWLIFTS